jgi:hypothetical protein
MVQRNLTPGGDKNGADINLALDALEMAFTHQHINAFVIVGGDSDFISLVEKLKQYDKKVFVVGGRQFTSGILQRNCHEFIAYENLVGAAASVQSSEGGGRRHGGGRHVRVERTPIDQAIPLVNRALAVITEREVSPQLGLLKSTLLQLDSTFSERNYGAGSFRDFVDKLAAIGVLRLQQGKGGWLVAPPDAEGQEAGEDRERPEAEARPASAPNGRAGFGPVAVTGSPAEGLLEFKRLLASATVRRWPMYLRNVKQILRQATPAFDERAYGYATLVDLLRAAQKDGVVRLDRDRQGVVRVFQGQAQAAIAAATGPSDAHVELAPAAAPVAPAELDEPHEPIESDALTEAGPAAEPAEGDMPATKAPSRRRRRPPSPRKPRRPRKAPQD